MARSIPARAGETAGRVTVSLLPRVYPRTGGGNARHPRHHPPQNGLSPHGRGKQKGQGDSDSYTGSIPARAGETESVAGQRDGRPVYPRTGGGNGLPMPAAGGRLPGVRGLSPHGRGKHFVPDKSRAGAWSIPARAGETSSTSSPAAPPQVYPRTGGGNSEKPTLASYGSGLSPHGRGKLL